MEMLKILHFRVRWNSIAQFEQFVAFWSFIWHFRTHHTWPRGGRVMRFSEKCVFFICVGTHTRDENIRTWLNLLSVYLLMLIHRLIWTGGSNHNNSIMINYRVTWYLRLLAMSILTCSRNMSFLARLVSDNSRRLDKFELGAPGSAPGQTLSNEYGVTFPFTYYCIILHLHSLGLQSHWVKMN